MPVELFFSSFLWAELTLDSTLDSIRIKKNISVAGVYFLWQVQASDGMAA